MKNADLPDRMRVPVEAPRHQVDPESFSFEDTIGQERVPQLIGMALGIPGAGRRLWEFAEDCVETHHP